MSDEQCAFDNWEEAADEILKEPEQTEVVKETQKQPQVVEQKPEEIKKTLKQKISQFQAITPENFQQKVEKGEAHRKGLSVGAGKVLKNEKDFIQFAKLIADKLYQGIPQEEVIDQNSIVTFMQELTMYLYGGLQWENFHDLIKKIQVVKNLRKDEEKKINKDKQKKLKQAKVEQETVSTKIIEQPIKKDDLFGGATMINSKQEQQQRKNKAAEKKAQEIETKTESVPVPVTVTAAEEDDDDFM